MLKTIHPYVEAPKMNITSAGKRLLCFVCWFVVVYLTGMWKFFFG